MKDIDREEFDEVIVSDDEAADFVIPHLLETKRTNIFFTGVNKLESEIKYLDLNSRNRISGILEHFDGDALLRISKELSLGLKSFTILTSKTESSEIVLRQVLNDVRKLDIDKRGIRLRQVVTSNSWRKWQASLREAARLDQIVWILVPFGIRNDLGVEVSPEEIGSYIVAKMKIPSLGIIGIHTKIGLTAAVSLQAYDLGQAVMVQVAEHLNGKAMSAIGIQTLQKRRLEINVTEAKRLGIGIPSSLENIATLVSTTRTVNGR